MAERRVIFPSQRAPLVGRDGRVDPVWYKALYDLYERTGGGAVDKVDASAGAAEDAQASADSADAAATAAQAAADAAQAAADLAEARLDFDFGFDIR